jgi:predicted  nucleic acid-binding Zn ribbon protein
MNPMTDASKRCPECGSEDDLETEITDIVHCLNCDTFARVADVTKTPAY